MHIAFLCLSDRLMLLLYAVTLSLCLLLKLNDDDDDDDDDKLEDLIGRHYKKELERSARGIN